MEKTKKSRKDIKPRRISQIIEDVGYWRKANQIHNWFVENVQDGRDECQESYVSLEKLTELRDLCKEVIRYKNSEFNNDNLPTSSGFFFGGTDYDEYYYEDCKDTIKIIDTILKEEEIVSNTEGIYSGEYYYQASW